MFSVSQKFTFTNRTCFTVTVFNTVGPTDHLFIVGYYLHCLKDVGKDFFLSKWQNIL